MREPPVSSRENRHARLGSICLPLLVLLLYPRSALRDAHLGLPVAAPTPWELLRLSAVSVAFALHVGSGLVWYLVHVSKPYMSWW